MYTHICYILYFLDETINWLLEMIVKKLYIQTASFLPEEVLSSPSCAAAVCATDSKFIRTFNPSRQIFLVKVIGQGRRFKNIFLAQLFFFFRIPLKPGIYRFRGLQVYWYCLSSYASNNEAMAAIFISSPPFN